jgi:hypothetical protein
LLILFFGSVNTSLCRENWNFKLISQLFFFAQQQRRFSKPAFKTQVLTQPDFEKPQKIHFKPEKGHFWFTLKEPVMAQNSR